MPHPPKQRRADLMLVLVTVFWGLTFPLIRISVQALTPGQFVAARFALAAIFLLPLLARVKDLGAELGRLLPAGLVLGFISWLTYAAQTIGLHSISAGRGAFITGTSVVLVPLLAPVFGSAKPRAREWFATLIAVTGLFLLTDPLGNGESPGRSVSGDLWVLLCALGVAVYIHLLPRFSERGQKKADPIALTFVQVAGVAIFAGAALLMQEPPWRVPFQVSPGAWIGLAFCATFATVGTFFLQTRFQPDTTPQRAALIFALEPVFASVFGYLILGETFSGRGYLGAALILAAVGWLELGPK